jgi:hypothetical protein
MSIQTGVSVEKVTSDLGISREEVARHHGNGLIYVKDGRMSEEDLLKLAAYVHDRRREFPPKKFCTLEETAQRLKVPLLRAKELASCREFRAQQFEKDRWSEPMLEIWSITEYLNRTAGQVARPEVDRVELAAAIKRIRDQHEQRPLTATQIATRVMVTTLLLGFIYAISQGWLS